MNKAIMIIGVVLMLAWGCDDREDIQGQWQTEDIELDVLKAVSTNTIFTFTQDGRVTINSTIEIDDTIDVDQPNPTVVRMMADASIDGRWKYAKGNSDQVIISLDDDTFALHIDPKQVTANGERCSAQIAAYEINSHITAISGDTRRFFDHFNRLNSVRISNGTVPLLQFDTQYADNPECTYTLTSI